MSSGQIWLFNIRPQNWRECADGPPDMAVHNDNIGHPWHGLNENVSWAANQMETGEVAIVRQSGHGVMGLWEIEETSPVQSQTHHEWQEEYEEFVYCRGLHRELEPPLDDTEFFDGQDYARFNAGANKLSDEDAIKFLEHIFDRPDLADSARERVVREIERLGGRVSEGPLQGTKGTAESGDISTTERAKTDPDPQERAADLSPPTQTEMTISRVVRNTELVKRLKNKYDHCCQICGVQRKKSEDELYAEGHHIHPLGADPPGLDHESNILVLCPNHHADFDYGTIEVDPDTFEINHAYEDRLVGQELTLKEDHIINHEYLAYHLENISNIE